MNEITIDLAEIETIQELHAKFKKELDFPDFYGMNWDAFWDSISGLVEMPEKLVLLNWNLFETKFQKDSRILKHLIEDFNSFEINGKIEMNKKAGNIS